MSLQTSRPGSTRTLPALPRTFRWLAAATVLIGIAAAVLVAGFVAQSLSARALKTRTEDHFVQATAARTQSWPFNIVTWTYPAGSTHVAEADPGMIDPSGHAQIWVDSSGRQVPDPPGGASIAIAALSVAAAIGLATAGVVRAEASAMRRSYWRRREAELDAQWWQLVHHFWEDL
jgi:hypothetical protein